MPSPSRFSNVTVVAKANLYFDGRVASHTLWMPDGTKKTLGLIHPGEYHFSTEAPERMDITAGSCRVKLAGETGWKEYGAGSRFEVPGSSSFDIAVSSGIAEYVCSFGS
jgi:hypothetical protein